ncbi:MAG: hypothetical protein IJF18_03440 [Oscillospiraceae bacterium]|nr:hypothetical protein [Oscillospiraceae bacterium]
MGTKSTELKKPIEHDKIYKIMVFVTFLASGFFFIKNIIAADLKGALVVGICLAVIGAVMFFMKKRKIDAIIKEFTISIALVAVVFIISLNSGASYSDDFPLFLALIGMTGMYLEPKITKIQIVIVDIALVLMYIIHPEKAESLSQYFICLGIFTLAGILFYLTIVRGRAFIDVSIQQKEEAERLIAAMREMGEELQTDFDDSARRIEFSTEGLNKGSDSIIQGATEVSYTCGEVKDKVHETERHIYALNDHVKSFETALSVNQDKMEAMKSQFAEVNSTIVKAENVFTEMKGQMNDVAAIANQLNNISYRTTLLSLNAAVEAAHVGSAGAGFAVVASEMKELSENSGVFSGKVSMVVEELLEQVEMTSAEFTEITAAINSSEDKMSELQSSFMHLTEQFGQLYDNIEKQNENVAQVDAVFGELTDKVSEMKNYSAQNQSAVHEITKTMSDHKTNIGRIIENTRSLG